MGFDSGKIPIDLIDSFKQGKGGLFVGAGLSQSAGLPNWEGLLNDLITLAEKVSYKPNKEFIDSCRELVKQPSKYLILAQELKDFLQDSFRKYIIEKYSDKCPPPTDNHIAVIKFPYQFIITTNYDTLLENAYVKVHGKQAKVHSFKDSPDIAYDLWNGRPFILKAHGDANKAQQGVILTENDYRQILFQEKGYQSILQSLFTTKTVLFLGSSLSDPELKLLLSFIHSSFHGGGPSHYALISEEEMNSVEAESWRKNFNIQIIPYSPASGHKEVSEFINEFGKLVAS
ncbi:SIR2 family protein [Sediminibacterium salmoneum]|uniref:SIR2 family protein n=1 Tax=Sediminibacterium salmoneum TaxID=426421 RepID=UPI00047EC75C|nr:SIR2 family protein [Sediminibacterium salmoneum]